MSRIVLVNSGTTRYVQNISIGPNRLIADEPSYLGGNDAGPNPYETSVLALLTLLLVPLPTWGPTGAERTTSPIFRASVIQVSLGYVRWKEQVISGSGGVLI
jgi:putative redox protein